MSLSNDFELWKFIFERLLRRALKIDRFLNNRIHGFICEILAKNILEKYFSKCKIKYTPYGVQDFIIMCGSERIYVEVKDWVYLNQKFWSRRKRMHIDACIKTLKKGKHYVYLFINVKTLQYCFKHGLYILKNIDPVIFEEVKRIFLNTRKAKSLERQKVEIILQLLSSKQDVKFEVMKKLIEKGFIIIESKYIKCKICGYSIKDLNNHKIEEICVALLQHYFNKHKPTLRRLGLYKTLLDILL